MAYSKNRRLAEIVSDTSGNISVEGIVVPTQSSSDNDTSAASTAFVHAHIDAVLDSAPGTLNTLNEIAAALNDDANFNTTVTNAIAAKLPLAGGALTGALDISGGAVNGTSFGDNRLLRLQNTSTTDGSRMGIAFQGNSSIGNGLAMIEGVNYDQSIGATDIRFSTYSGSAWNSDMMTLSNNGKVGIGVTTPAEKLHVSGGNVRIDTDANSTLTITDGGTNAVNLLAGTGDELYIGPNNAYKLRFKTDGDIVMDNNGSLGIGTDSPSSTLHIANSNGVSLRLEDTGSHNFRMVCENGVNSLNFKEGGGNTILSLEGNNQRVGIGTTSPEALLHLKSTSNTAGPSLIFENTNNAQTMNIDYYNNAGAVQSRIQYAEGPSAWTFQPNVSTADSALTIHYNGSVDLGGVPSGSAKTHGVVVSDEHKNGLLGTTLGDTQRVLGIHSKSQNQDYLTFRTRRITDGQSGWNHAVWDITRDIDNTSDLYRYITFGIGDTVINDFGANMDFRVESDSNEHMIFVDGGASRVGIGTSSPAAPLDIKFVDNTNAQRWSYGSSEDNFYLELDTAIPAGGVVSYNFNTKNNGTLYNNNLVLDRGKVGIGTASPGHRIDVNGVIGIKGNSILDSDGTSHYMKAPSLIYFYPGNTGTCFMQSTGFHPMNDNAVDLGKTSKRWRNIYTGDLHLSNEGSQNDVDGTSGNWTIQEGEEHLFIINNKNGKKYKFALEEIT